MSPRLLLLPLLALGLAACTGLRSGTPAEQLYVLQPAVAATAPDKPLAATLQLQRPVAQPGLDTARIALLQPGNRLDYFAGGRWAGLLESVAEAFLTQSLRASGRFAQVVGDGTGMGADLVLEVTLRHFEADYTGDAGAPVAHVGLECTLSSRKEHRQLGSFDIDTRVSAGANRLGSVVSALQAAAREAAARLAELSAEMAVAAPPAPAARPAR